MLDYGVKGEEYMNNQINYESAPDEISKAITASTEIADFLPPPELLIPKEETTKITIALSKKSIDFLKDVSKKINVPYQQMIKKILDTYTEHYTK